MRATRNGCHLMPTVGEFDRKKSADPARCHSRNPHLLLPDGPTPSAKIAMCWNPVQLAANASLPEILSGLDANIQ